MMELLLSVSLPDELFAELTHAAKECAISPTVFAAEAIHSVLASRRLPNVAVGRCGARLIGDEAAAAHELPEIVETFAGPLEPLNIATVDDLESLEDIT